MEMETLQSQRSGERRKRVSEGGVGLEDDLDETRLEESDEGDTSFRDQRHGQNNMFISQDAEECTQSTPDFESGGADSRCVDPDHHSLYNSRYCTSLKATGGSDDFLDREDFGDIIVDYEELIAEIEQEMRQEEEVLLREYEENLLLEDQYIEQLGQEYEEDQGEHVVCPVCNLAELTQTSTDVILCLNRNCLRINLVNEGLNLHHVKKNLATTILEHSTTCNANLKFLTRDEFGITTLIAGCELCGSSYVVI